MQGGGPPVAPILGSARALAWAAARRRAAAESAAPNSGARLFRAGASENRSFGPAPGPDRSLSGTVLVGSRCGGCCCAIGGGPPSVPLLRYPRPKRAERGGR